MSDESIIGGGADGAMLADFRAVAEATTIDGRPRHDPVRVMPWLAKLLVGRSSGPNKDTPLYELCHLINAVDAAMPGRDGRWMFFLDGERSRPSRHRHVFDEAVTQGSWYRSGFERTERGIAIRYDDSVFNVTFGRMPALVCLYEFLVMMDGCAEHDAIEEIFSKMLETPDRRQAIQAASNELARLLRQYRKAHLAPERNDERFNALLAFTKARNGDSGLIVDDAAVLAFWLEGDGSGDRRAYRTVFTAFIKFMRALSMVASARAGEAAAPIGTDLEAGEIEPVADAEDSGGGAEWISPLDILGEEAVAEINFLKKSSERQPLVSLMKFGPDVLRLPQAFLRYESFGAVQAAITNDLQVKRGADQVRRRLSCDEAESYGEITGRYDRLNAHIDELQKASLHVLLNAERDGDDAVDFSTDQMAWAAAEALAAFRRINRKGFEEIALGDDDRVEGFSQAAGALRAMSALLTRYQGAVDALAGKAEPLDHLFESDREIFRGRFAELYGEDDG